ncbi:TRAP transporter small permease subunit [Sedimentitalea todarodis]|uniref:TRAP transporter small permease protein n=1 Tax=Sedimentitalea todarodis TaxID=1631240 RepID=A0ABU3VGM4_9RHOB|nr:TRAP transporter small permease [Sedimentitalea todarodis]MDU9005331.1 TRAP transporter small permease [Sedimentitalea todarodis]
MFDRTLNAAETVSRVFVWVGGSLILGSAILVTIEVFLRKFLNVSLGGADEISGYAFGVATSLGFAYALFERAHIRVDAVYTFFPKTMQRVADLVGLVLLVGFGAVVAYMAWSLVGDTLKNGSRSITPMRTPLAIPQIPWLIGWLFFVATGVLMFIAALANLFTGRGERADQLIGMKTLSEQIEDETV